MISIITNDILNTDADLILHQVNPFGVMGAGLALQIKNKYPNVFTEYRNHCLKSNNSYSKLRGDLKVVPINDKQAVVNMFSQSGLSRHRITTDYQALSDCLNRLHTVICKYDLSLAIPYGIGCGLAGGQWELVFKMIQDKFQNDKSKVLIYKKQK